MGAETVPVVDLAREIKPSEKPGPIVTPNENIAYDFDMLVMGSGPAGQRAAIQAAKLGKQTAIIEQRAVIGGVCINTGTIPSKTLREAIIHLSGYRERNVYGASYSVKRDITMDDLQGGTFTITNGGVFGSLLSTPILNPPQSAILGMHTIKQRPIVVDGEIVARPMMYIALTYDHRIVDGRDAVLFLVTVKDALEDPARMLLNI